VSAVVALVDAMLDHVHSTHPHAEWNITIDQANSLLLPKHSDTLPGEIVDGRLGYFRGGHVYRDTHVVDIDFLEHYADMVMFSSYDADVPTYYGDLRTGTFSTTDLVIITDDPGT
jgi:hypothetical protein